MSFPPGTTFGSFGSTGQTALAGSAGAAGVNPPDSAPARIYIGGAVTPDPSAWELIGNYSAPIVVGNDVWLDYPTGLTSLIANGQEPPLDGRFDVRACASLKMFDCTDNAVTAVDATGCKWMTDLYCSVNPVATLDLSGMDELYYLDASYTGLTTIDLAPAPEMQKLILEGNHGFVAVDLTPCLDTLDDLRMGDNEMDAGEVDAVLVALAAGTHADGSVNLLGNAVPTAAGAAAKLTLEGRGWSVQVDA